MLKIHFPALVLQIKIYLIIPLLRYCPQPNPYRVHPVSRNARCAASCGVSPKTLHFFILLPSALPTIPSNCILPSGNLQAYAPIGIWQSPPVPFKNSRSAHVISSVTISESAFTCSNNSSWSSRNSSASVPCAAAGIICSGSKYCVIKEVLPSRCSPAAASTIPSSCSSCIFFILVSTFPRIPIMRRSFRSCRS